MTIAASEAQTEVIHCRLSPELLEKVDEHVEQLKAKGVATQLATRSGVVRVLLARQFSDDPHGLAVTEVMAHMPNFLQKVSTRALERTLQALPEIANQVAREVVAELFATSPVRKRRR